MQVAGFLYDTVAHVPGSIRDLQIFFLNGKQTVLFSPTSHSSIGRVKFLVFHIVCSYGFWNKNDKKYILFLKPFTTKAENYSELHFHFLVN